MAAKPTVSFPQVGTYPRNNVMSILTVQFRIFRSRGGGDDGNACGIPAGWDPMRADFEDPDFNCYDRGPGSDLPRGYFTNRQTWVQVLHVLFY